MAKSPEMKRLKRKRNLRLIERYYHWTEVKRRRFDDVITILKEEEFFVGEQTIMAILRKHAEYLDSLINNKPATRQLKLFDNE